MANPNGRKPPNPTRLPKQHGRMPPVGPPHPSRGRGCALELAAIGTAVLLLVGRAIL